MAACVATVALTAGAVAGYAFARRERPAPRTGSVPAAPSARPADVLDIALDAALTGVVVLDGDEVVWANPAARDLGVVRDERLTSADVGALARRAVRERATRQADVMLRNGRDVRPVHVVAAPAGDRVALLVDDMTETARLDAVRRDFVANVSHELKTPVGALSLLDEAIQDCGDDPEAVRRFADRMLRESGRLARLIQELIDLSWL